MKKIIGVFCALILVFLQCGCYDSREIDETAYIIAIGIDDDGDSGFSYTFQFAAPLAISGEGGGGEESKKPEDGEMLDANNPGVKNTRITAADFYAARNMLNNFLSKNIDMSHLKMIVFSSSVEDRDFLLHSQLFRREREVRPHTVLAVSEGSAEEFLRCVNPQLEANTAKYYELMSLRSNNIYAPSVRIYDFADRLEEGASCVLPLARVSRDEPLSQLMGMKVFVNSAPVGSMDADSSLIYNILRRDIKNFTLSLENPREKGTFMTFNVRVPSAAQYSAVQKNEVYTITVRQALEPKYIGDGLPPGYTSEAELMSDFNKAVTARIENFFYQTTHKLGADIMETGDCVKKSCAALDEWDIKKWNSAYKNAKFRIEIDI